MENMESQPLIDRSSPNKWYGARHTQAIMMFFLIVWSLGTRVNLSVAIVAMTTPNTSLNPDVPSYNWTDQNIILSSYFWGYVVLQIYAGQLVKQYGSKLVLLISSTIGAIFTMLIPITAKFGSWAVILCRVVEGLCQGCFVPCCHNMLAQWVPKSEKSRLGTFIYAGGCLGVFISMTFTGWISSTSFGWPYSFYCHGIASLLWTILWMFIGKNSPADHTGMDPGERQYIKDSLGNSDYNKYVPTPWKAIATSLPVWAILVSGWGQVWGFATLVTNIPTYLANVLHYDIKANGLLSAGPYLLLWMLSFVFSAVTDYVISRNIVSTVVARKIANSVGLYIPGLLLLLIAILCRSESDITIATLVIFFFAVGVSSAFLCGYHLNHIDLSPVHAGTLMGITNGLGNVSSIIGPLVIQFIVTDHSNATQWSVVFYISSAMYIIGNTFYICFASCDLQAWNNIETCLSSIQIQN